MAWYRRFLNLLRPNRLAREHEREMDFHIAERTDELMAGGMPAADARREARRRFGNRVVVRDRMHDVDVMTWLESLVADLRYAARTLRAHPGFTLVAVSSLGLGIGANTAIFTLIDVVMLRPLPVRHPAELVRITMADNQATFTNPLWEQVRDREDALAGAFAFADQTFDLATGGVVRNATGAWVSGDYFAVLGVSAAIGRVLEPGDDRRGCPAVAVLGHGFWQREYGGDADAVGRSVSLDGHPFVIVGVTRPGFSGIHVGRDAGVFVPLCTAAILREGTGVLDARSTWFLNVFGRLRPDRSLAETRARLAGVAPAVFEATVPAHWSADEQRAYREGTLSAVPATNGLSAIRGQYRDALYVLLAVVGVVLLIACANVAQLLLARATARQHEIAVRLAIGSGRARLVRQLLTESLVLALMSAALGTLFARWASGLLVRFLSDGGRTVSLDLSIDLRILGFTIAVATATGVLFGLAPAWRASRVHPQSALRSGGRGLRGDTRQRFGKTMVIGQVALSLVLVVAAGLLVGSFQRLATVDAGFRRDSVLVVEADWTALGVSDERSAALPRELLERVRAVPGVLDASASLVTPIGGSSWNDYVMIDGYTPAEPRDALVWFNAVTDGFLTTLGTALLAGRDLTAGDRAGTPRVALINQTLSRRFFGDARPLGRALHIDDHDVIGPAMEIVGIVEDAKYRRLDEEALPTAYVPLEQAGLWSPSIALAVRTDGTPTAFVPAVTAALTAIHPAIALEFTTLRAQVAASLARPRMLATLSGFFGALALLLSIIGLYGTLSYSVARRRGEIGIRIALGAARVGVLRMVASEAGRLVGTGIVLGAVLALALTRLVAAFLYGVSPSDPVTLALSALTLATVATAASVVPAWRAARVDPVATLREE